MEKEHSYQLQLNWTGNRGAGTNGYNSYDRKHQITAKGKTSIDLSSDPAFLGDSSKYNPEELLLASLASCHMLWYLHLCSDAGIIVHAYTDEPSGTMLEKKDGSGHFTSVILRPQVQISNSQHITQAKELHHTANKYCFIANSCNFPVTHEASIVVREV